MSKYHNYITRTSDGIKHDSRKEANRWCELKLLERAGQIKDLQRQVKFELIPAQYIEVRLASVYKRGPLKGQHKTKRVCVEQSVCYVADFVYVDVVTGEKVVEDTKSDATKTKDYKIKRKLMLYLKNIRINEI